MFSPILKVRARVARLRSIDRWPFAKRRGDPDTEIVQRVNATIASMPMLTREVFIMHRFDDLSYTRIAHRLDIGIDEVEHHMSKALMHLWRELGDEP